MSTVNDVIVSYGGDSKRYSRDFQTKEEFKKSWYAVLSRAHASVEAKVSCAGNDSNLLIVFYVQIVPDDFVMQLHRFGERQGLPAQPCQMLSQIQVVSLNSLRVTLTDDVQFSLQT